MRLLLAALFALLPLNLMAVSAATLKWDQTEITVDAPWESTKTVAEFHFRNEGQSPVTILDMKSNCGCTTAALEKRTYGPGEEGKIVATFEHGDRVGPQKKIVAVLTDENGRTGYPLTLNVDIPRAITVSPQQLQWRKGGQPVPQKVNIELHEGFPGKIARVAILNPHAPFDVSEPKQIDERHYEVTITPQTTKGSAQEAGAVASDKPAEEPKIAFFYLLIR